MTIHLVETYEEDACVAVARHIASLLDEGQVRRGRACGAGCSTPAAAQRCVMAAACREQGGSGCSKRQAPLCLWCAARSRCGAWMGHQQPPGLRRRTAGCCGHVCTRACCACVPKATPACLWLLPFVTPRTTCKQAKTALADTPGSLYVQKAIDLAAAARWADLISHLAAHLDLVFAKCSDKDAECIVSVIVLMVARLDKDSHLAELARKLAAAIGKQVWFGVRRACACVRVRVRVCVCVCTPRVGRCVASAARWTRCVWLLAHVGRGQRRARLAHTRCHTRTLRTRRQHTTQPEAAGEVKLNGLLALYTSCSTAPAQYLVLLHTLEFAQQSKQLAALLVPTVKVRVWLRVCVCVCVGGGRLECSCSGRRCAQTHTRSASAPSAHAPAARLLPAHPRRRTAIAGQGGRVETRVGPEALNGHRALPAAGSAHEGVRGVCRCVCVCVCVCLSCDVSCRRTRVHRCRDAVGLARVGHVACFARAATASTPCRVCAGAAANACEQGGAAEDEQTTTNILIYIV
jgi:hypothetical protein